MDDTPGAFRVQKRIQRYDALKITRDRKGLDMTTVTAADLANRLPDGEVIPLAAVSRIVGWGRDNQAYAVKSGYVTTTGPLPAGRRGWQVTRDEALTILAAAAIAFAAGLAIVTILTAIKAAGLNVAPLVQGS